MQLLDRPIYLIGEFEVDPTRRCLRRGNDEVLLRQKSFQVLLYLLDHHERLVTKEELLQTVWNGTAVTDDTLVQIIVELRKVFGDDSRQPRFIRTVPKVGYHFIAPVNTLLPAAESHIVEIEEVTTVQVEVERTIEPTSEQVDERANGRLLPHVAASARPRLVLFAAVGLLAVLMLSWLVFRRASEPANVALPRVPGKKPVAVMYFENRAGDRELDWLREGLADMLIASLSRSPRLTLLSRQQLTTLLSHLGQQSKPLIKLEDGLEIARRAQAETIILGGFARLGDKVRIDVTLHDARTGQLQAAESMLADTPAQILTQIDLLSVKLATHLGATLADAEAQRGLTSVMTDNLDAYRYYSLAVERAQNYHSNEALQLLEKAIALDPTFAMAYARIGYIYTLVRVNERVRARPYLDKALQLAQRLSEKEMLYVKAWAALVENDDEQAARAFYAVIAQDPREVEAYFRLSFILRHGLRRADEALRVLEQAAVIDPEAPHIQNQLGLLYQGFGRYPEAIAAHTRYVQLAPNEPNAYDSLGTTYTEAGEYPKAMETLNRALALNPDFHFATRHLGDVYFHLGRYRDALRQYQRYQVLAPTDWDRAQAAHLQARVYLARSELAQAAASAAQEQRYGNDFGGLMLVALTRNQMEVATRWQAQWKNGTTQPQAQVIGRPMIEYLLGRYALKTGATETALQQFHAAQQAEGIYWGVNTAIDGLGQAYLELGRWDEAIAEYERLAKLNPHWARAQYQLGQAYDRKGASDKARAAYQRFLALWQDADAELPEVQQAKARLQ